MPGIGPKRTPRYRQNRIPNELRKGMRVFDIKTGMIIYTKGAAFTHGGYTEFKNVRLDPRSNAIES